MRMNMLARLVASALLLLLAACASTPATSPAATPAPTGQTAVSVAPAADPDPDKASVAGQIISTRTNAPLANRVVRLAEVIDEDFGDGDRPFVFSEAFSPGARTDADGRFVIANIPAKEYVMIISNDMGENLVVTAANGQAEVWNAAAGVVLDVGAVRVDFP
jgi:hypothetical protein